MQTILFLSLIMSLNTPILLYKSGDSPQYWTIINDTVMGGISKSFVSYAKEGYTKFEGKVSTAYNGGFSAMKLGFETINIEKTNTIVIHLKGDGKRYQFRVKEKSQDAHSFIHYFETNGKWQTIEIPMKDLKASFRGRMLNTILFSNSILEEVGVLIGNKTNETFELLIASIYLK
ncbi:MAG: CIA30 family protein [Flavobacteriaceae bacterium]|nr:CIA30 family protein [Flavobacteriaceae bacterium]